MYDLLADTWRLRVKNEFRNIYFHPILQCLKKILESQQKFVKTLNNGVRANFNPDYPRQKMFFMRIWERLGKYLTHFWLMFHFIPLKNLEKLWCFLVCQRVRNGNVSQKLVKGILY